MTQMPPPQQYSGSMQPHRGVMILVFGILGIVICFLFGIAAWVMGNADIRQMDSGVMDPSGRGMALAGKILGIISVVLAVLVLVWVLFVFVIFAGAAASGAGGP